LVAGSVLVACLVVASLGIALTSLHAGAPSLAKNLQMWKFLSSEKWPKFLGETTKAVCA
jgi:hypothetical protein